MEPLKNRLCGRRKKPIHSILNSIVEPIEKVKKDYDYILIVGEIRFFTLKSITNFVLIQIAVNYTKKET